MQAHYLDTGKYTNDWCSLLVNEYLHLCIIINTPGDWCGSLNRSPPWLKYLVHCAAQKEMSIRYVFPTQVWETFVRPITVSCQPKRTSAVMFQLGWVLLTLIFTCSSPLSSFVDSHVYLVWVNRTVFRTWCSRPVWHLSAMDNGSYGGLSTKEVIDLQWLIFSPCAALSYSHCSFQPYLMPTSAAHVSINEAP